MMIALVAQVKSTKNAAAKAFNEAYVSFAYKHRAALTALCRREEKLFY